MPIKKSKLEGLWYYRVIKTIILLAPLLIGLYSYGMGYVNFDLLLIKGFSVILQIIGVIILYYIGVSVIWRIVLYVVFGGLENDMKPKIVSSVQGKTPPPTMVSTENNGEAIVQKVIEQQDKRRGEMIMWIIFIICVVFVAIYGNRHSSFVPGVPNPSPKCVPTGCGKIWHCSGTYYSGDTRKSVNGCYVDKAQVTSQSSWSGTCRRCP